MDALYFRVSSVRQTAENQFEDLLEVAEKDGSARDWPAIRAGLAAAVYTEDKGQGRIVYHVRPEVVATLAGQCVYVEQGKSSKVGAAARPLFERMKRDAAARRFDRLLVWKVSRLGRDMREVISTVYELADLGVTVVPVKSATGPISSTMGKLLWAIQAWFAEYENSERSETIKAGQSRARASGKHMGRPRTAVNAEAVAARRALGESFVAISAALDISQATARRLHRAAKLPPDLPTTAPVV